MTMIKMRKSAIGADPIDLFGLIFYGKYGILYNE